MIGFLQEGQKIRGAYEVDRFLGEGAFAEVYRVRHRFLGRQAMKVFKMSGMTLDETETVLEEAILLSRLGHPNVVRVFNADTMETPTGVRGFFTMEYVAGGTLDHFWKSHASRLVPVPVAVEVLRQCCRGLAIAHGENPPIVHRDIKPQNILVGYDAAGIRVRVSDFGLAKRVNPLTLLATSRGTLSFKPPETLIDAKSDSCAGDVWALGSTLYLLLTDRLPYGGADALDLNRFDLPLVPPSRLNIQADQLLDQIVLKALARDPKARYPRAHELLADLERWQPQPQYAASAESVQDSKSVLGRESPPDEPRAREMAVQAFELARVQGKLSEAADLMEESFNGAPDHREEYEYWVRLWRRGIVG
jgi:eukaryotic-like serine/threonine-protein kinase